MFFYDIVERKNAFLGYKKQEVQKVQKLTFFKGVNPWFCSKNDHFSKFFFKAIQAREMSFTILQKKKMPFQAIRTRSSKSRKLDIVPKGLTHGFGPEMAIFPGFLFLDTIGQKNDFYDMQNGKNDFLGYKNKNFKQSKLDIFPKGLTHGFGPKMAIFFRQYRPGKCLLRYSRTIFPIFFSQYRPGKCLLQYSRRKKTVFTAIKTRSLKSRKINIFPKGLTHGFAPKMAIFLIFFFWQYRPGKYRLRYSRTKKRLSRL